MVSNASDDLPDPDRPVMTTSASRGIFSEMSRRLCSRAPETTMELFDGIRQPIYGPEQTFPSNRTRTLRGSARETARDRAKRAQSGLADGPPDAVQAPQAAVV